MTNLMPTTSTEDNLDRAALVASFAPWVGGAISGVLGGMSQTRKFKRVAGVLQGLSLDLETLESDVSKHYVKTEDFEDLLERTLRKAAEERNEEVREWYRLFLRRAIVNPGDEYDHQVRVLNALELLRNSHVAILRALLLPPSSGARTKPAGSIMQTLGERTGLDREVISDGCELLNELKLTNLGSLLAMMTGHGSENLTHAVTQYGLDLLSYIDGES